MVSKRGSVVETSVIWCGDNLEKLKHLPDGSVDLIYIDPPFNSNRNYEVFWGETKEKRSFEDRRRCGREEVHVCDELYLRCGCSPCRLSAQSSRRSSLIS